MSNKDQAPSWLELESVQKMQQAEQITSLSPDSLRRLYPHLVVKLSERRDGIKLRHCLEIANGTASRA
jgi:hypothetical protein